MERLLLFYHSGKGKHQLFGALLVALGNACVLFIYAAGITLAIKVFA